MIVPKSHFRHCRRRAAGEGAAAKWGKGPVEAEEVSSGGILRLDETRQPR